MERDEDVDRAGNPTGDQVEEIYRAIARLAQLYRRVRAEGPDAEEIPEHLRAILRKLRQAGR